MKTCVTCDYNMVLDEYNFCPMCNSNIFAYVKENKDDEIEKILKDVDLLKDKKED